MTPLKLVEQQPDAPIDIAALLIERDRAKHVLDRLEAMLVDAGRERWRAQGMRGTPTIGQMRLEVGKCG